MNPNWLWLAWIVMAGGGFAALEILGAKHVGGMQMLTYWFRWLIAHGWGWLLALGLGGFFSWFTFHLFLEPFWRSDRLRTLMRRRRGPP